MIFQSPHPIDVTATVEVPTPESWQAALPGQDKVPVLRLCDGAEPPMPGWCTAVGELQGPEIEVMCGGINDKQPTHAGVWRQGHLLHFGFEPGPSQLNATGRKLLLNGIAYIARFTTDRPIVREQTFVDPRGSGMPTWRLDWQLASGVDSARLAALFAAPWQAQLAALDTEAARAFVQQRLPALRADGGKFVFDADAQALGVDVRKDGVLLQLAGMLQGEGAARALALLQRLLPDGPGVDTTPNNWGNWLQARKDALCFDPHSHVWRLDPVAQWRGLPSSSLRGPSRADGDLLRDAEALALAAKIGAHHGGARALDDLQSFRCTQGGVRYLWDRQGGVFRMEHHGTIPAGNRATPWQVAIFDTAADADIQKGGGPEPRPFVSARGGFCDLVERLFLPLLLLDPGTSLRLLPDDEAGHRQLEVRLAGRCMDQKKVHVLHVDAKTGAVIAIDVLPRAGGRATSWRIEGAMQVGPLSLPSQFVREGKNPQTVEYSEAEWNPPVPPTAASAREMLLDAK